MLAAQYHGVILRGLRDFHAYPAVLGTFLASPVHY